MTTLSDGDDALERTARALRRPASPGTARKASAGEAEPEPELKQWRKEQGCFDTHLSGRRVRVALVDRHALLAGCLSFALERSGCDTRLVVVPTPPPAPSVEQTAREVQAFAPQAVIISWDLGPHGETEALLALLSSAGIPVIVLAQNEDAAQWGAYVVHGARAVVPMTASLSSVCAVVQHAAAGMPVMSRAEHGRLAAAYRARSGVRHQDRELLARLTPNETDVLRLLMAGSTPTETARSRVVSVSTVRTQVRQILAKLQVHSQVAAVATAYRAGWSPSPPRLPRTA